MKRILGLEYEYGLLDRETLNFPLEDKIIAILNEKNYSVFKGTRIHLKNGSQLYSDLGHIEAALPECSNPRDLVIYDEAISRILTELGEKHGLLFFKNNVDSAGNTFGCHENYFISREQIRKISKTNTDKEALIYIARLITPFLITRIIYTGSGSLENGKYLLSQRARAIRTDLSDYTTTDRPIFNLRNEPLSDTGIRVHIIIGDSNMSEFSTYLKLSTTSIILNIIETGFLKEDFNIKDPVKTLKAINENGIKRKIKLNNSKLLSPIDIQKLYLEKAYDFFAKHPHYMDEQTRKQLLNW